MHDVLGFDFLDPPPQVGTLLLQPHPLLPLGADRRFLLQSAVTDALKQLYSLGALRKEGDVTPLGKEISEYPLEPALARMLISAKNSDCLEEVGD